MTERIPRSSVSVRFFDDEDALAMFALGAIGERAILMFLQLLTLAKDAKNGGVFSSPIEVYATRLHMTPKRARECFNIIARDGVEWVAKNDNGFKIRSWERYNDDNRGGARPGAGRPPKSRDLNIQNNQNEYRENTESDSKVCASYSVTDSCSASSREEIPKPGDVGDGNERASEEGSREELAKCGVDGVALSVLSRDPRITASVVRDEFSSIEGGSNRAGVLVSRLCSRFNVALPRGRIRGLEPSIAASVSRLTAAVNARQSPRESQP